MSGADAAGATEERLQIETPLGFRPIRHVPWRHKRGIPSSLGARGESGGVPRANAAGATKEQMTSWDVTLTEGFYISLAPAMVFTPYAGPSFSFK